MDWYAVLRVQVETKTLQVISEALSDASIPVVLMDIKGDPSGIGAAGTRKW